MSTLPYRFQSISGNPEFPTVANGDLLHHRMAEGARPRVYWGVVTVLEAKSHDPDIYVEAPVQQSVAPVITEVAPPIINTEPTPTNVLEFPQQSVQGTDPATDPQGFLDESLQAVWNIWDEEKSA